MKVAICSPIYGDPKALFAVSLFQLVNYTSRLGLTVNDKPDRIDLAWHTTTSINLARARERLGDTALDGGADCLLWLDVDHTFPADTLIRLLAYDLPIVGCNYRKRNPDEARAVARKDGKALAPKAEGLEPVDYLGFGVLLMKAATLKVLSRPWFEEDRRGEDYYFCEKARAHGIQPYVDHALSMEVGHIAETVLTFPR